MTEQDLKFKIESYCKRKRNVKTKKNNIKAKGEAYENAMSYPSDAEVIYYSGESASHCRRLAKEADVSTSTLHALMAGKTKPYMYTVYKLCNALDISIMDLLDDEDMPENTTELNTKEREIISTYRKYSRSKKEMLGTYMKMLEQFEEI